MSELAVLGGGQDRTRQTTVLFLSTGRMLVNAAAQIQHKQKYKEQNYYD